MRKQINSMFKVGFISSALTTAGSVLLQDINPVMGTITKVAAGATLGSGVGYIATSDTVAEKVMEVKNNMLPAPEENPFEIEGPTQEVAPEQVPETVSEPTPETVPESTLKAKKVISIAEEAIAAIEAAGRPEEVVAESEPEVVAEPEPTPEPEEEPKTDTAEVDLTEAVKEGVEAAIEEAAAPEEAQPEPEQPKAKKKKGKKAKAAKADK